MTSFAEQVGPSAAEEEPGGDEHVPGTDLGQSASRYLQATDGCAHGEAADEEQAVQEDCASYLVPVRLHGRVGDGRGRPHSPSADRGRVARHSFSRLYVEFPLDLAWKYHFRAVEASKKIGELLGAKSIPPARRSLERLFIASPWRGMCVGQR